MPSCPHSAIEPSLDRWQECHWHLHQMEANYHDPEPFRYALNSFLRAVKEIPVVLDADLQKHKAAKALIAPIRKRLSQNALFAVLSKRRDFIVHQGMLTLESRGSIGTTEGRKVKLSFPFRVHPNENSDAAYARYKEICRTDKMWRGLGPDCDSAPALWRTWMIPQFPNRDLLDITFEAWTLLGELLSAAVVALGGEALDLSMPCRHDPDDVKIKRFSQHEFFLSVDGIDLKKIEEEYLAEKTKRQKFKT
jgi:hypothetical protein